MGNRENLYAVPQEYLTSNDEGKKYYFRLVNLDFRKEVKVYENKIDWKEVPRNLFTIAIFFALGMFFGALNILLATVIALIPAISLNWRKEKFSIYYLD